MVLQRETPGRAGCQPDFAGEINDTICFAACPLIRMVRSLTFTSLAVLPPCFPSVLFKAWLKVACTLKLASQKGECKERGSQLFEGWKSMNSGRELTRVPANIRGALHSSLALLVHHVAAPEARPWERGIPNIRSCCPAQTIGKTSLWMCFVGNPPNNKLPLFGYVFSGETQGTRQDPLWTVR